MTTNQSVAPQGQESPGAMCRVSTLNELVNLVIAWRQHEIAQAWLAFARERLGEQAAYMVLFVNDEARQACRALAYTAKRELLEEIEDGITGLPVPHSSVGMPDDWRGIPAYGIEGADPVLVDLVNIPPLPAIYYAA